MGGKTQAMQRAQAEPVPQGPRWFVVVCQANQERKAKAHLVGQKFDVYLPMRLGHPKSKRPVSPFFPRYLFVRFDPDITQWLKICSTEGVHDILRTPSGHPQMIPDRYITQIMGWEVDGVIHLLSTPAKSGPVFKPGQKVTVKDGHFAGMSGLVHIAHDNDRVTIMLALVEKGESLKVELKSGALEGSRSPVGI